MKNPFVELTLEEMYMGAMSGLMRRIRKLANNQSGVNRQPKHLMWQVEIEGALSEMAYNKWAGTYWYGGTGKGAPDSKEVEIRTTRYRTGGLTLFDYDKKTNPNKRYYLLSGLDGKYKICGWITPMEGVVPKYWTKPNDDRPGYYLVPQSDLKE